MKSKNDLNDLPLLREQRIPQGMITLLENKDVIDNTFLDGIGNMQSLEKEIFRLTETYNGQDEILERVFHMVQIWGGMTGRHFYVRQNYHRDNFIEQYRRIAEMCRTIHDSSLESQRRLFDCLMHNRIRYVGVSFMTKHTRFWLVSSCGGDVLPIYDKFQARRVMGLEQSSWKTLIPYWERMKDIAKIERKSLLLLEREMANDSL